MLNVKRIRGRLLYRIMSLCCALAFAMYGYDAGVLGGVQTTKPFLDAIGNPTGPNIIPMIASSYTLAAAVCSVCVTIIGMPLGRRNCILIGDGLVIVGGIIQSTSFSVAQIIVGRILCGFGIGFVSCSVPTYMAEMSLKAKQRGPEIALQSSILLSGVAFAYWVDFGFTRLTSQVSWRFPIGFQAFFATFSGLGMLFLPDTPRWYYAKDRHEEADSILCRLWDRDIHDPDVQAMKMSIIAALQLEKQKKTKFRLTSLIWDTTPLKVGRRIRIAFLLSVIQQMIGINVSVYYATIIFSQVGVSPFLSQLLAGIMSTLLALGSLVLPPTIERFGRRTILMGAAAALATCLAIFIAMIGLPEDRKTKGTQWTGVVVIIIYNFFYGYGYNALPLLYAPEIAPLMYRHVGAAAACVGQWLFSFITVFAGGIALNNVGWKIWIWYLLSSILATPFVYFFCPETRGKSLEEIDLLFTNSSSVGDSLEREIIGQGISSSGDDKKEISLTELEKNENVSAA